MPDHEAPERIEPPTRPLLSLTIPTYNRCPFLAELLEGLLPQLLHETRVELLLSDNASSDGTTLMLEAFAARGLTFRYLRNAENIGPDANFLQCLEQARGQYVWVLGDDDLLAPKAIAQILSLLERDEYDLVHLSSLGFSGDDRPTGKHDALGRFAELVTDGDYFLQKINALIGLISASIVNKDRLLATPHPPITDLNQTNLLQVGWLFPVIHRRCRILYIWERLLFYRSFNSGGWGICEVFGLRLNTIARRYFAAEPSLAENLMNGVLTTWMPDQIMQMRLGHEQSMETEDFAAKLKPAFGSNWRYWLLVFPVIAAPLPLARQIHRANRLVTQAVRAASGIIRQILNRKNLLTP